MQQEERGTQCQLAGWPVWAAVDPPDVCGFYPPARAARP